MSFPVKEYLPIGEINEIVLDPESKEYNLGFVEDEDIPSAAGGLFITGNNMLIIEECATVFEKGQARLPEWGKRHCFYGRHMNCSLVLIAQRPTYIPIDFRSQANRIVTFSQGEDADMDWLKHRFGKERMERLDKLPKFYCYDFHNGQVREYSIAKRVEEVFNVKLDNRVNTQVDLLVG
jgi:hypothetical protein